MSSLDEIFLNIDSKIAKTNSAFAGWNDANSVLSKEMVNNYSKALSSLMTKATDATSASREMKAIQDKVQDFCKEVDTLR